MLMISIIVYLLTNSQWRQAKASKEHWQRKTDTEEKWHTYTQIKQYKQKTCQTVLKGWILDKNRHVCLNKGNDRLLDSLGCPKRSILTNSARFNAANLEWENIFLGKNLRDICKQNSAWRTGGRALKTMWTSVLIAPHWQIWL